MYYENFNYILWRPQSYKIHVCVCVCIIELSEALVNSVSFITKLIIQLRNCDLWNWMKALIHKLLNFHQSIIIPLDPRETLSCIIRLIKSRFIQKPTIISGFDVLNSVKRNNFQFYMLKIIFYHYVITFYLNFWKAFI